MDILIENYKLVLAIIVVIAFVILGAYKFFTQPSIKQKEQIRILLLNLVVESEKLFGSKTGKIKFSYVYSKLVEKLPYLRYIPLSIIEVLIEESLEEMRHLLETNPKVAEIITRNEVK